MPDGLTIIPTSIPVLTVNSANVLTNSGTYTLTVDVDGCVSAPASTNVVVNASPVNPAPTAVVPACAGNALTLSSTGDVTYTYNWTGPNGFTANSQNVNIPSATTLNNGTYTVTVSNGACTNSGNVFVSGINSRPTTPLITNYVTQICEGEVLELGTNTYNGDIVTYTWTLPNATTIITNEASLIINPVALINNGNYIVSVNVDGCTSLNSPNRYVRVNASPVNPAPIATIPACTGGNLTLNASGNASHTYLWTGPNGFTSTLQNPVITNVSTSYNGNYTVVVSNSGCSKSSSVFVSGITPKPTMPLISSPDAICEGNILQLSVNQYEGTSVNYTWHTPVGNVVTMNSELIINPATTLNNGFYSVEVNVDGCNSVVSNSNYVDVETISAMTLTSNGPLCEGNQLLINVTPAIPGAYNYTWNAPSGDTYNQQNVLISNAGLEDEGIYQLTIFSSNDVCMRTEYLNVDILQKPSTPVITGNSPVCLGNDIRINVASPANNYYWTLPNGSNLNTTISNLVVTYGAADYIEGNWSVYIEDANGCYSDLSNQYGVVINEIPTAPLVGNNGPICSGDVLSLTSTTVGDVIYNWTGPNGFVSGLQNPQILNTTPLNTGTYSLVVSSNGCSAIPVTTNVTVNATPAMPAPTSNAPVCQGYFLELFSNVTASGYLWSGPDNFSSSAQNPIIPNVDIDNEGTYQLVVYENNCPSLAGAVVVDINGSTLTPSISNNSPVCENQQIIISTDSYTGNVVTYYWYNSTGQVAVTDIPTLVIDNSTPDDAGAYNVVVEVDGCSSLSSGFTFVDVNLIPEPPVIISNSPVCEGSSLLVWTESIVDQYYWVGPNGFTSDLQYPSAVLNVNANNAGVYSLMLVNEGCAMVDTTTEIVVNEKPQKPYLLTNSPVCLGEDIILTTFSTADEFVWTTPYGLTTTTTIDTLIITPAQVTNQGDYYLSIITNGCESDPSDMQTVIVNTASTENAYAGEDVIVCGDEGVIYLNSGNTQSTGYWTTESDAVIITPYSPQTVITNLVPGNNYEFMWTLTSGACNNFSEDYVLVKVAQKPEANPNYYTIVENDMAEYLDIADNDSVWGFPYNITFDIYPENGDISINSNQTVNYTPFENFVGNDQLLYEVCIGECANLCDTAWVFFEITAEVTVYDIITPNGDGDNDALIIGGVENFPDNELTIFNRWGNQIYLARDYQNDWEGTYKGNPVPAGTYFYVLKNTVTGELIAKGYITLQR